LEGLRDLWPERRDLEGLRDSLSESMLGFLEDLWLERRDIWPERRDLEGFLEDLLLERRALEGLRDLLLERRALEGLRDLLLERRALEGLLEVRLELLFERSE
jgi:hypothetical protein